MQDLLVAGYTRWLHTFSFCERVAIAESNLLHQKLLFFNSREITDALMFDALAEEENIT
jgi:hypothetical protein